MATKIIKITCVACVLLLLDSTELEVNGRLEYAQLRSVDSLLRTLSPQGAGEGHDVLCSENHSG